MGQVILQRIGNYRTSLKRSLLFSSFFQFILDFNGITSINEELVKSPKPVGSTTISLIRYYKDKNNEFYYLDTDGCWGYEDMIVEPKKKNKGASHVGEASSSSIGFLSAGAKVYFDNWLGKILDDNHVCEDMIMEHIEDVAKEVEKGRENIREEVETSEARVMVEVSTLKYATNHIRSFAFVFNIDLIDGGAARDPSAADLP